MPPTRAGPVTSPRASSRSTRAVAPRRAAFVGTCLLLSAAVGLSLAASATAATPTVDLGSATSVAVLAGSTITNTGPSVLTGDLALSPGTAVTGFPPGVVVGATYVADASAAQAQADATAAYSSAGQRASEFSLPVDPSGQVLTPGVYDGGTLNLTGTVTLDGGGDPAAVFLIRLASTLDTAAGSSVALSGGAQSCNVFWTVGSSATLGAGSTFRGTILAVTSISTGDRATVDGRLLARTGAVTLIDTDVTRPVCAAAAPAPAASTAAPAAASPSPSPTAAAAPAAAPASASASPTASATVSMSPAPATASPSASASPAAPSASPPAPAPAASSSAPGPMPAPVTDVAPVAEAPVVGPPVPTTTGAGGGTSGGITADGSSSDVTAGGSTTGGSTVGDAPQLPRTGADSAQLVLLGLLALSVGGVLAASGHAPAYAPRHAAARSSRRTRARATA